jgi:bifunctional ADP-heptose synthase (sugar kinase/adenylyltransferase)
MFDKVLIIGDIFIESNIFGDINRISPEAPVPILNINKIINSFCDIFSYAVYLNELNVSNTIIGFIGKDYDSKSIIENCSIKNINHDLIKIHNFATFKKINIKTSQQNVLRIDQIYEIENYYYELLFNKIKSYSEKSILVFFSESNFGTLLYKNLYIDYLKKNNIVYIDDFNQLKKYFK